MLDKVIVKICCNIERLEPEAGRESEGRAVRQARQSQRTQVSLSFPFYLEIAQHISHYFRKLFAFLFLAHLLLNSFCLNFILQIFLYTDFFGLKQ